MLSLSKKDFSMGIRLFGKMFVLMFPEIVSLLFISSF